MFKDAAALDRQVTATSFEKGLEHYSSEAEKWFNGSVGSIDARLTACNRLLHSARATVARMAPTDAHRYLRAASELERDRRALLALRDDLLTGASGREDVTGPPGWRTAHWFKDDGSYAVPNDGGPHPSMYASPHEYLQARNMHNWINRSREMTPGGGDVAVPSLEEDIRRSNPPAQPGKGNYPQTGVPANPYRSNPINSRTSSLDGTDRRWVHLESARFVAANTDALADSHELATRAHNYAAMKTSSFTSTRSAAICEEFVARVTSLGRQTYRPRVAHAEPFEDFDAQAMYLC